MRQYADVTHGDDDLTARGGPFNFDDDDGEELIVTGEGVHRIDSKSDDIPDEVDSPTQVPRNERTSTVPAGPWPFETQDTLTLELERGPTVLSGVEGPGNGSRLKLVRNVGDDYTGFKQVHFRDLPPEQQQQLMQEWKQKYGQDVAYPAVWFEDELQTDTGFKPPDPPPSKWDAMRGSVTGLAFTSGLRIEMVIRGGFALIPVSKCGVLDVLELANLALGEWAYGFVQETEIEGELYWLCRTNS